MAGAAGLALSPRLAALRQDAEGPRPNLLVIITDQQSLRAMGAYGNAHVRTPHMDSIATAGVRFESSYCAAPICRPARSSLVTGRMPHDAERTINALYSLTPGLPTYGDLLGEAGYQPVWAGKWHLPDPYPRETSLAGFRNLPLPGFRPAPDLNPVTTNGKKLGVNLDPHVAHRAVDFLREEHERPFALTVSLLNPHDISHQLTRKNMTGLGDVELPPLPANFGVNADEPGYVQKVRFEVASRLVAMRPEEDLGGDDDAPVKTAAWGEEEWRVYLYLYYRLVEQVDAQIGRVLAALREEGLEESTVVLLTSDHGEGMAAHRWLSKGILYEEAIAVPLVVSWKGVTPPGLVDREHLVSGVDILPTLCDYAGAPALDGMAGVSLRPYIEEPQTPGREELVVEMTRSATLGARMLRTRRFKYMLYSEGERAEQLYDLVADPGEMRNLAREEEHAEVLREHRRRLRDWVARTEDPFTVPDDEG